VPVTKLFAWGEGDGSLGGGGGYLHKDTYIRRRRILYAWGRGIAVSEATSVCVYYCRAFYFYYSA
jgi:hypothetical protein